MRYLFLTILLASLAFAQGPAPAKGRLTTSTVVKKGSSTPAATSGNDKAVVLRPPKGEKVAIVIFEDLECPDCGRAHPLLMEAKKTYNLPVVVYDFPLPMHPWAYDAALYARYFRAKSMKLDAGWRDYIFSNQASISTANLKQYAETFAKANSIQLPVLLDPNEKLDKAIKEDIALGKRIGVLHTPTIWVVNNSSKGDPFVEVVDRGQLYALIDRMKSEAK